MYNLYELIKAGTPAEDLAKNFTEELNAAIKQVEGERKVEEINLVTRKKDAQYVADVFNDFAKAWAPTDELFDVDDIFDIFGLVPTNTTDRGVAKTAPKVTVNKPDDYHKTVTEETEDGSYKSVKSAYSSAGNIEEVFNNFFKKYKI